MTNCCDRLIHACETGNVELVKEILNKSIKKLRSKGSKSLLRALSVACEHKNLDIIKLLIENDVDAHAELYKACRESNIELAKFIIKHIETSEYLYTRCLQEAAIGSKDPSGSGSKSADITTIEYFLDKTTHHHVAFYAVCKQGNLDAIKLIIYHQFDHNHGLIYYGILNACLGGQLKAFKYLLHKINVTHDLINNSFSNACISNNIQLVRYIYNLIPEHATYVPRYIDNIQVIKYTVERGLFVFRGPPLHIFEPAKNNRYYTYLSDIMSYKHRLWFFERCISNDIVLQIRKYVG
jgi:ankyrin repeat protein